MANAPIDRLLEQLWPEGDDGATYAVLDGARSPDIVPLLVNARLPYRCLYIGPIAPALARAAPYVVNLPRGAGGTREILRRGWGEAWGIFLRTRAPMGDLHRHLRRFLRVQDEQGRKLLFRYYDPRVMRAYLPTCTADELAYVFGPIESYIMEGDAPERIVEYRTRSGVLAQREVRVERRLDWLGDYLKKTRTE